ncbi:uncharacterized protein DSM5745_09827 [Aspergillus mulundensis]|uniref:3-hydroxyisobutyrate dehydrogenase-like NAD-binding domain-containing protein n=1 Tax=Aspergillus mulundensis TaxID=1810919 RepID=A0A3D8QRG9_9EURO|nr:hypothetical protein DSM5745_09827 [Aspergillus mulundensis]RDW64416.1 hypothetical protein DSM5745_09827 [Aspergillus mulundensis]
MLEQDWTPLSALNIFVKDMGIVVSTARATQFPLPVASVAEQLYISASAKGYGKEDDAGLVRLFLQEPENSTITGPTSSLEVSKSLDKTPTKVAVFNLDDLGCDLAVSFANSGFNVHVFDVDGTKAAGDGSSPRNQQNCRSSCRQRIHIIALNSLSVTGKNLAKQLADLGTGISLIDAPVCHGGSSKESPTTTMLYSGTDTAIGRASGIIAAAHGAFDRVRQVSGGLGSASTVKLIDQMLSGIQLLAAAEAMAFASHLSLSTSQIFHFVRSAAAWSWMLETRVPMMLEGAWAPPSQSRFEAPLSTLARDLGWFLERQRS